MPASSAPKCRDLPFYAPASEAFHRAFASELRTLLKRLPLAPGDRVLDVACGDGTFSRWFAELTGSAARVVALDLHCDWIKQATHEVGASAERAIVAVEASAARTPFDDDQFDLVWCAQSFRSLTNVPAVLREMTRVVRPGGVIAVLEDDALHQVQLPWPAELELAVRTAELEKWRQAGARHQGYYIARRLVGLLIDAGLTDVVDSTASFVRQAPLDADSREFFEAQLSVLEKRVWDRLTPPTRDELHELLHGAGDCWLDRPDFSAVCEERLAWGFKPHATAT